MQTVKYAVIWDGLMNRPFRIMGAGVTLYNKFLIEWVAIQYHYTFNSLCLYLACPINSSIQYRLIQYPVMILDSYPSNKM